MKNALLLSTTLTVLTTAPVYAQSFSERVVNTLSQQGFQTIEIDEGPTQTKFEAVRNDTKLELIYDRANGAILKQETERFVGTVVDGQPIDIDTRDRDFLDDDDRDDDDDDDDDDEDDDNDNDSDDDDDDDDDSDDDDDDGDDDRDDDNGGDDDSDDDSDDD
ncbi:PepSY domain-containing protein [Tateyamaria armeniaca]|uniref:PepSY domain-containing protein n=1 Tax=Tateyamaria armeniaca TaxID=2518930 RepID=A0ABW8V2H9_9RHOB